MIMKASAQTAIQSGFSAIAGTFVLTGMQNMIPWLIVMFSVIMCDLVTGIRKSTLMGIPLRLSKAFRDTLGKMVVYTSAVIMLVLMSEVFKTHLVTTWGMIAICVNEGLSIVGNTLKPKGYNINLPAIISLLFKKMFNIDKEYSRDILNRDEESLANNKTIPGKTRRATRKSKDISNRDIDCSCDGTDGNN